MDRDWRVIDSPGFFDTNTSDDDTREEIARFTALAPHGVSAFVFVVQRGRFTDEQERALRALVELFGPDVLQHSIVAVTAATDPGEGQQLLTRDYLLEEVGALPLANYFRQLITAIGWRLVPVENRLDPHRQISRMALHQRIADVIKANGGRRYDCSKRLAAVAAGTAPISAADTIQPPTPSSSPATGATAAPGTSAQAAARQLIASGLHIGPCSQRLHVVFDAHGRTIPNKLTLEIRCNVTTAGEVGGLK